MQHYIDVVQDRSGNAIGNAIVTVKNNSSGQTAPTYSDSAGLIPLTSIMTANNGTFSFYIESGRYNISITKNGVLLNAINDIFITVTADYPTAMSQDDAIAGINLTPQTISADVLQGAMPTAMSYADAVAGTNTTPQSIAPNVLVASNIVQKYASVNNIPANFAGIAKVGTDLYVGDGVNTVKTGCVLYPSGSDDGPAMVAMALSNNGVVNLGVGNFKINTPIILVPPQQSSLVGVQHGISLVGQHAGATTIDTSGISQSLLKVHDTFTITNITNANPCVVTVSTTIPETGATTNGTGNWTTGQARVINGTPITIQTPATTAIVDNSSVAVATMEAINGLGRQTLYMKKLTNTTFSLYIDSGLTVGLNTTDTSLWGTFNAGQAVTDFGVTWNTSIAWKMRRYYGNYAYTPAIRIVAPINIAGTHRTPAVQIQIKNIGFKNVSSVITSGQELHGIAISLEDNITTEGGARGDSSIQESNRFDNLLFYGYDACIATDDDTNTSFTNCSFEGGNYHAVFMGYNSDIYSFYQCRFGDEGFTSGIPLQQILRVSPVYLAPANIQPPAQSQTENLAFYNCWMMQVHDVAGDLLPTQLLLHNNYFEKARLVCASGGQILNAQNNHFTQFSFGANLKNNETVFGFYEQKTIIGNECLSATPKFGWVEVFHNLTPETTQRLKWSNNILKINPPSVNTQNSGHIKYNMYDGTTGNAVKYITLYNDVSSGSELYLGRGDYQFIGADQTSGDDRVLHLPSYSEGTNAPARYFTVVPEQYNVYQIILTNPTQFWDPSSAIDANNGNGRTWNENHNGGADYRCFKVKPLIFILTQDTTGGRVVSFTSGYITTGLVSSGTANQRTRLEFCWNGAKWQLKHANVWG